MKFLLTVHQFYPAYSAGTEVLTLGVAKELARRGHQVCIFTAHPSAEPLMDGDRFDEYMVDGIQVFRFHHAYVPMGGQQSLAEIEYDNHLAADYFAGVVARVAPDVIHFFHLCRLGAGLIDIAVSARIPAYYTPTDFWAICPTQQLLLPDGSTCSGPTPFGGNCVKHLAILTSSRQVAGISSVIPDRVVETLTRVVVAGRLPRHRLALEASALSRRKGFIVARLNALHRIFSPTRLMTDTLLMHGVDSKRIEHMTYGIAVSGYIERARHIHADRPITFGFIGTLSPHKGCHILVEAFRGLDQSRARLEIYGNLADSPKYVAELQELAQGSAIEFRGTFPNASIGQVLAGIDAMIVPSLWQENTPLVVYSALAAKCPVVASDFRGMTEAVQNCQNGLVFSPGNVRELQEALQRLIDEPELLARLSANCQPPKSMAHYVSELLGGYESVGEQDVEKA
jgi:glycosyltransferase involved in cell wall biosynthesis